VTFRKTLELETRRNGFIDITNDIEKAVEESKITEGLCNVFLPATTAGLVMNENERMLIEDFRRFFADSFPDNKLYNHPSNAFSHLRATLVSTEKTIPVFQGKLVLGTWQSILLWEFDIDKRKREVVVTIIGDKIGDKDDSKKQ
jgi:secondary thiamine-phosphate synthase enzyme